MASLHPGWIRTPLAPRWARDLLSLRRPEADGCLCWRGPVIRCPQDAVPDAGPRGCERAPHELCPGTRRTALPGEHAEWRCRAGADHGGVELDGGAGEVSAMSITPGTRLGPYEVVSHIG